VTAIHIEEAEFETKSSRWELLWAEVARQEAFRWAPVVMVLGIWLYFALPVEPSLIVCAVFAIVALFLFRNGNVARLAAILLIGFIMAKGRADWVATPPLERSLVWTKIEGVVEDVERRGATRARIKLRVVSIAGLAPEKLPHRLLLTIQGREELPPLGARIAARAMLTPLPVPVMPGGFDYGRTLWFEGIGGTGRIAGPVTITPRDLSSSESAFAALQNLRGHIGERIKAVVPRELAGFAEAIITGERGAIPKEVNNSLQVSGLAHILSISGLHMTLVAGGVFWLVRATLALFPGLTLRRPIKKWAAVAALLAGLFYMLLAGAGVATQRSYIMLAVMFLAVLLDRPAMTMRNLSLAALIVLAIEPEAAVTASFQMSFLAVAGLVALTEAIGAWRQARAERRERGWIGKALEMAAWTIFVSAATGLVAGSLSSIPAVYHFGRLAPLSLLANLLALPVVSVIVMPMAVVAMVAMPLGLEALPLWAMGEGLRLVMAISDWVASLPGAKFNVAAPNLLATLLITAGALWLCFWRGVLRFMGIALSMVGLLLSPVSSRPDILVEESAANVAMRNADGRLVLADPRKGRFAAEKWLIADGDPATPAEAAKRLGWSCEGSACRAVVNGKRLVFLRAAAEPQAYCAAVDILIAAMPLRGACKSVELRIDRFAVWRRGAHGIWLSGSGLTVETSRQSQGARPWTIKRKARLVMGARPTPQMP
jgi:competence protein ComEC